LIQSGSEDTWPPAGVTIIDNTVYFVGLRGQALYTLDLTTNTLTEHLKEEYGRLRVVKQGPDGFLYLATSNRDGRGEIKTGDDKIIRLSPSFLE
jgi:glucose/arabinose dehydrogenase